MNNPPLAVGTVGPQGSGKTTLSLALARHFGDDPNFNEWQTLRMSGACLLETDNENPYFQSQHPMYLSYTSSGRGFTHIDTAGNPSWGHLALWGISQMDAAVIVVRAASGIDEPLRETLRMVRASGIQPVIAYINAVAGGDRDLARVTELELREALNQFDYRTVPVIHGNARQAYEDRSDASLQELARALEQLPETARKADSPFLFRISEVQSITGHGTIVMGRVERGRMKPESPAELLPIRECPGFKWPTKPLKKKEAPVEKPQEDRERHGSRAVTLGSIQRFRQARPEALAGDIVGILIHGLAHHELRRGDVLAEPGSATLVKKFQVRFGLFEGQGRVLRQDREMGVHIGPRVWGGLLARKIDKSTSEAAIELYRPFPLEKQMRLVVRQSGLTLGWAQVSQVTPYEPDQQAFVRRCPRCHVVTHTLYLEKLTTCSCDEVHCAPCREILKKEWRKAHDLKG